MHIMKHTPCTHRTHIFILNHLSPAAGVGRKTAYLYNLPEVESAHKHMRVPSVSARFSTDPFFWNWAMWLTARLTPRALLNDRGFVKAFAKLSDPFVRSVDKVVGETVVRSSLLAYCPGLRCMLTVHPVWFVDTSYASGICLAVLLSLHVAVTMNVR
jgi:hypothetical protein